MAAECNFVFAEICLGFEIGGINGNSLTCTYKTNFTKIVINLAISVHLPPASNPSLV